MKYAGFKASALALAMAPVAVSAAPTVEELYELVKEQQAEIERLKEKVGETSEKVELTEMKIEATADAVEQSAGSTSGKASSWAEKTNIGGYGEHHYNNFDEGDDKVDAHRFVLFLGHEYSDNVRFFSELEVEHSYAGEGKPGAVELEQAYVEWDFAENHSLVSGLFLVPVGILNETHEPETFYGVERNQVEKNIIPTTWWETGAMLRGEFAPGVSYNFAIHSGLKTDDGDTIRGGRQKSAKATANDLAYTGRLKYTGVPGLELAATFQYQENITQGTGIGENSATLLEAHGVYRTGPFELRALYADWNVDGETFETTGRDQQSGWYAEPSYKFTDQFGVFVRYASWNNEAGLSGSEDSETLDYGFNFWLHPRVVFKADYQDARGDLDNDSLNLGVGWSF